MMSMFKVGDKVRCLVESYGTIRIGGVAVVTGVDEDSMRLDCLRWPEYPYMKMVHFELVWVPEVGEMVEVSDSPDKFLVRQEFRKMDEGIFICRGGEDLLEYDGWRYARQIKKSCMITLEDGTKVELSEESYAKLAGESQRSKKT